MATPTPLNKPAPATKSVISRASWNLGNDINNRVLTAAELKKVSKDIWKSLRISEKSWSVIEKEIESRKNKATKIGSGKNKATNTGFKNYNLARCYELGILSPKDPKSVFNNFYIAAHSVPPVPEALYKLGEYYHNRSQEERASHFYYAAKKAGVQLNGRASFLVANYEIIRESYDWQYNYNSGFVRELIVIPAVLSPKKKEMIEMLLIAVNEDKLIDAQYAYAKFLDDGVLTATGDREEIIIKWYTAAAKEGHIKARYNLAKFYYKNGKDSTERQKKAKYLILAHHWFRAAKQLGQGLTSDETTFLSLNNDLYVNGLHSVMSAEDKQLTPTLREIAFKHKSTFYRMTAESEHSIRTSLREAIDKTVKANPTLSQNLNHTLLELDAINHAYHLRQPLREQNLAFVDGLCTKVSPKSSLAVLAKSAIFDRKSLIASIFQYVSSEFQLNECNKAEDNPELDAGDVKSICEDDAVKSQSNASNNHSSRNLLPQFRQIQNANHTSLDALLAQSLALETDALELNGVVDPNADVDEAQDTSHHAGWGLGQ